MKKIVFVIILILNCSYLMYGQKDKPEFRTKIDNINYLVKSIDSIGKQKNEGVVEGVVKYSHGPNKNYGWEAYFLNDENGENPLRIRYNENTRTGLEYLNLYYDQGQLIYSEFIKIEYNRKLKPIKKTVKKFNFENDNTLNPEDILDKDSVYILEKGKQLVKEIYKI